MIKNRYKIAYVTLEMTTVSILNKFIAIHTGIDLHKILNPKSIDNIDNEIIKGCEFIRDSNMILETARGKTEIFVKSKIKKYAALGYDVVIVDLIDKIKCSERKQSRNLEIQHISRALFEASKEYDITVIAIVQLNREAAKMEKPALHHLKESGDLEQDADVVFLIARPEQTNETVFWDKTDATNKARLIKAKDRMGATGYVTLGFNPQTTYFYDLDTIDYEKQNPTWENAYINHNEQQPF
jgi:replicative DNA helicase